jgi:hypothetical protein
VSPGPKGGAARAETEAFAFSHIAKFAPKRWNLPDTNCLPGEAALPQLEGCTTPRSGEPKLPTKAGLSPIPAISDGKFFTITNEKEPSVVGN